MEDLARMINSFCGTLCSCLEGCDSCYAEATCDRIFEGKCPCNMSIEDIEKCLEKHLNKSPIE